MSEWRTVKLGEVSHFKYGKSKVSSERQEGKYDVFSSSGHCGYSNDILAESGIIVGRKGTVGSVFYSSKPFFCIDTAFYIDEVDNQSNILFLYYYLKTLKFENYNNDAAVPGLNRNLAHGLKIRIPNLETQEKIANILSTYDKLIENNNRRIQILEQTAEELYKEWFVRMRFPGYEKTKFEKGIPEGWEVKRVKNLGEVITGKTPSTNDVENYGEEIMFIKTPDMTGNLFTLATDSYLSEKGNDTQPKKLLPKDAIMVSCIGTGGVVSINGYPAHTNQQINSIVLNNSFEREWTYFTLKSMKETIELFGATGATMTNLSKGKFENLKILYPAKELVIKFNRYAKDIFNQVKNLTIQNQNLAKQRDLLLPRLMNGTISVE